MKFREQQYSKFESMDCVSQSMKEDSRYQGKMKFGSGNENCSQIRAIPAPKTWNFFFLCFQMVVFCELDKLVYCAVAVLVASLMYFVAYHPPVDVLLAMLDASLMSEHRKNKQSGFFCNVRTSRSVGFDSSQRLAQKVLNLLGVSLFKQRAVFSEDTCYCVPADMEVMCNPRI